MVKLPSASSAAFVLRFLEKVCRHLQCDNLFSSQPFSPYSSYDRSKSGIPCTVCKLLNLTHTQTNKCITVTGMCLLVVKEEMSEAPALNRGVKRISRDSPPYSAPLSPKILHTDTHPSEGTAWCLCVGVGVMWLL